MANENPSAVRYLVFEGGGAQAAAYLGAIVALMDSRVNILRYTEDGRLDSRYVKGIAGSSSGAVAAALVATGYRPEEVAQFTKLGTELYEEPLPRAVPFVPASASQRRSVSGCMPPRTERYPNLRKAAAALEAVTFWSYLFDAFKDNMDRRAKELPLRFFVEHPAMAIWLLAEDYGVFAGCRARSILDAMIGRKTRGRDGRPRANTTFEEHFAYHRVKLVLAGTDLETGALKSFSVDSTPDFAVADAVRIAMGFPFMFKPVVIPSGKYEGTWVDSGVVTNFPLHAFSQDLLDGEKVLGLRLRLMQRQKIKSLYEYVCALVGIRYEAGMLSQVATRQPSEIIVEIDATRIAVFDIVLDPLALREAVANGVKAVMKRFTGQEAMTSGFSPSL